MLMLLMAAFAVAVTVGALLMLATRYRRPTRTLRRQRQDGTLAHFALRDLEAMHSVAKSNEPQILRMMHALGHLPSYITKEMVEKGAYAVANSIRTTENLHPITPQLVVA